MKRIVYQSLRLVIIAGLLAACSVPAAQSAATEPARPEGQEVIVWHPYAGAERDALLQQIDNFNAVNPWHIVVVPEYHGNSAQLGRDLTAGVDTGALPDLVIRRPADVWSLGAAVVPMQTYADDEHFGLTTDDLNDLFPAMLDIARDPKLKTLIGLPLGGEGVVLVTNNDRLAAQNYLTPPNSWPLFREVCQNITRDTTGDQQPDVYGFGFNPRADFATAWLNSRGGSILTDDGTRTSFNAPEGVNTLRTLQETAASGCFFRTNDADAVRDFARGKVGMIFATTTQLPEIFTAVEARGGFRWSAAPVPYGRRDPTLTITGPAWFLLRGTPSRQLAAWLFVRWFSETPQTVRWSQLTGLLPLRKSAAQGLAAELSLNAGLKVAFDLLSVARAQPDIPQWDSVAELLVHAVNAAVDGNDPERLLNEAAQVADGLLSQP